MYATDESEFLKLVGLQGVLLTTTVCMHVGAEVFFLVLRYCPVALGDMLGLLAGHISNMGRMINYMYDTYSGNYGTEVKITRLNISYRFCRPSLCCMCCLKLGLQKTQDIFMTIVRDGMFVELTELEKRAHRHLS